MPVEDNPVSLYKVYMREDLDSKKQTYYAIGKTRQEVIEKVDERTDQEFGCKGPALARKKSLTNMIKYHYERGKEMYGSKND